MFESISIIYTMASLKFAKFYSNASKDRWFLVLSTAMLQLIALLQIGTWLSAANLHEWSWGPYLASMWSLVSLAEFGIKAAIQKAEEKGQAKNKACPSIEKED